MKHFTLITRIFFTLGLATIAASAAPCGVGSLATYAALGSTGCTIGGDYTFSDFNFIQLNVLGSSPNASSVTITPTINAFGPQLTFSGNFSTGGLVGLLESLTLFNATASNGATFQGVDLIVNGSRGPGAFGLLPTVGIAEVNCSGGLLNLPATFSLPAVTCAGLGVRAEAYAGLPTGTDVSAFASILYPANTTQVAVLKDLTILGVLGSTANITSFSQQFYATAGPGAETPEVPEPSTALLVVVGGGLVHLARRRAKS